MIGFIKLHRKMQDWEWYTEPNTFRVFFHCLLKANFEDKRWRGVEIKRGQFITSIAKLATELELSEQNIRTALKNLETTGEVTRSATNRYTLLTVVNYSTYQDRKSEYDTPSNKRLTNDQQTPNKRLTNDQQTPNKRLTTTKKDKNNKNEEKEKNDKNVPMAHDEKLPDPIKIKMLEVWNSFYLSVHGEDFETKRSSAEYLKKIYIKLKQKAEQQSGIEPTENEVFDAFSLLLNQMGGHWRSIKQLKPSLIHYNLQQIILEIKNPSSNGQKQKSRSDTSELDRVTAELDNFLGATGEQSEEEKRWLREQYGLKIP